MLHPAYVDEPQIYKYFIFYLNTQNVTIVDKFVVKSKRIKIDNEQESISFKFQVQVQFIAASKSYTYMHVSMQQYGKF